MYKFDERDLTSEKSLWDVFILSKRILPSKLQVLTVSLTFLLLCVNSFLLTNDLSITLSNLRIWAEVGFTFSTTVIGFLIAGFTIFATLSKPKMMLAMMDHINKSTGLPTLKYNFFAFMKVFIAYISALFFYISIMLFGQQGGLVSNLVNLFPESDCIKYVLINIIYSLVGCTFIYLTLMLKTFIFNIYAIVMNMLRWEYHQND